MVAADKPACAVIIIHGLGEHSGRYTNLISAPSSKKISFFAVDLRGHGESEGQKGHVQSFMDYVYDLKIFVNMIREAHTDLPVYMLGHSLGGAIACRYALTYQNDLSGLILSSPAITLGIKPSLIKKSAAHTLSVVAPATDMANELNPKDLSHDEEVVKQYIDDPLVHDRITPRLYTELVSNGVYCLERAADLRLPFLVLHGTADKISDVRGSQLIHERSISDDKHLSLFPDLFHETMNEKKRDRQKVISTIIDWIVSHYTQYSSKVQNIKKSSRISAQKKKPSSTRKAVTKAKKVKSAPKIKIAKKASGAKKATPKKKR